MTTMTPYHDGRLVVWGGDCLTLMAAMAPDSVDAIVTDPPYGLGFMGKKWDDLPPGKEWAEAAFRVLKPGGHILAFGGTRTWHRLAVAIEDGGFEIRDSLAWLYGSGFPKSMDVSKAIDKAAGVEREVVGIRVFADGTSARATAGSAGVPDSGAAGQAMVTAPTTPEAQQWQGWGTALKPAFEPIVVGRKPLVGTVAANVLAHGTGALNIDATRIDYASSADMDQARVPQPKFGVKADNEGSYDFKAGEGRNGDTFDPSKGRWPANVILDESQAEALDRQAPKTGASRYFYCAKAPKSERPVVERPDGTKVAHPTVKPVALMRWLVRLVTPPDGLVLDTFAGTGTTGEACVLEGFRCLLAEDPTKGEQDYLPLIDQRITRAVAQLPTPETEKSA